MGEFLGFSGFSCPDPTAQRASKSQEARRTGHFNTFKAVALEGRRTPGAAALLRIRTVVGPSPEDLRPLLLAGDACTAAKIVWTPAAGLG